MKRPNGSQYAAISKWLQDQQKTNALNGLTFPKIATRASVELSTEISSSTIQTLAHQLGYKYHTLKQPDLLEDKSPTDSARIKNMLNELTVHGHKIDINGKLLASHSYMLIAICKHLGIEVSK
jgi:hypothetical protein